MIIRCPFCTRSHSIAEITKEQIQSEADNPTGVLIYDLPNPSADEEAERLAVKMAADCYQRLAIYRPGILTEVQTTLKDFAALIRQQHNAEREERNTTLRQLIAEIEPLADQIIDPEDNTFRRQITLIKSLL